MGRTSHMNGIILNTDATGLKLKYVKTNMNEVGRKVINWKATSYPQQEQRR